MVRNLKDVTIPKDMPAPRRAQKSSLFWVLEAVTRDPSASTISVERRKSRKRPWVWVL